MIRARLAGGRDAGWLARRGRAPFEILDATHKKVIDGAYGISCLWYGKSVTATLFANTPAGIFGMAPSTSSAGCTKAAGWSCGTSSTRKN